MLLFQEMERRLEEKLRISQKDRYVQCLMLSLISGCSVFTSNNSSFSTRLSSGSSGRSPIRTAIMIQDDSLPAAPPPQIRILKRPTSNGSLGSSLTQNRPSPQVKSLAQREAEYAEARKRILGSADDTPQERPSSDR